jgi:ribosome-binding protein aMBF1 (putative translation factor)
MAETGGFLYAVAAEGHPLIKIGATKGNVQKRLQGLRVGQPFGLTLLAAVEVPTHLYRVERALHRHFAQARKRGEWFECAMTADEFRALVTQAQQGLLSEPEAHATFGRRLRHLREQRDWSMQELAERSGIPYETIYRVERGTHQEPRISVAVQLARTLGISLDVLGGVYEDSER